MRKTRRAPRTVIKTYNTYVWGGEKDPVIDEMRTKWEDSGETLSYLCDISGVSQTTTHNWFKGKTRRPQNETTCAFMGALGYERRWVQTAKQRKLVAELAKKQSA